MALGLNVQPADDLRLAQAPIFATEIVDAIEWTWEGTPPAWLVELATFFAGHAALYGHLVAYPVIGDDARLAAQLAAARALPPSLRPRHVTAHFGVIAVPGWRTVAPLPVIPCAAVVAQARERLAMLRDAVAAPVGLENLAMAHGLDDVRRQGDLLDAMLVEPSDVLLLDVHNLHCQAVNLDVDPLALLASYPLARVRELHVSGGRTATHAGTPVRRDTHDDDVPAAVFELAAAALARCPHVELVVLERLGHTIAAPAQAGLLADARRLHALLAATTPPVAAPARVGTPIPPRPELGLDDVLTLAGRLVALAAIDRAPTAAALAAALGPQAALLAGAPLPLVHALLDAEARWATR